MALEIRQSLGLRAFNPSVTACPGCGRTTSTTFQELAKQIDDFLRAQMPVWKAKYPGVENLKVAVMGCIVNGCLLYTSPSPRDRTRSRMPSSA